MWSEVHIHQVTWHWESVCFTLPTLCVSDDIVDFVTPQTNTGKSVRPITIGQSDESNRSESHRTSMNLIPQEELLVPWQPAFMFVSFLPSR